METSHNRKIAFLFAYCVFLTVVCGYLFFLEILRTPESSFHNLTIQDTLGHPVLVASRILPNPVLNGKEYPRQMGLGGITFYSPNGDETGGIGIIGDSSLKATIIDFDYKLNDAIAMYAFDRGNSFESGIGINDKDSQATNPEKVHRIQRITISDDDKNASIILRDEKGRDRIILSVDSNGEAKIEKKDTTGRVVE
jgi:hypothetical protein